MIFFWVTHVFLSIIIAYSVYRLIDNLFLKIFVTSLFFGFISSFWFLYPGSNYLAPVMSIIFLELTIIESNGIERLLRVSFATFILSFIILSVSIFIKKYAFKKR